MMAVMRMKFIGIRYKENPSAGFLNAFCLRAVGGVCVEASGITSAKGARSPEEANNLYY